MILPRLSRFIVLLTLLAAQPGVLAGAAKEMPRIPTPRPPAKVALTACPLKGGNYKAGFEVQAPLPESGWQCSVGGEGLIFLDLNGDGALEPHKDGLAMPPFNFVVKLPPVLLLKSGQYELSFDGTKQVMFTAQDLGAFQKYIAEAATLTEMRVRAGLTPVALDADACAACEKHCDYLKTNNNSSGAGGMSMHTEDPQRTGYTPEGAKAGAEGDIFPMVTTVRTAIQGWYATPWHGAPIFDPALASVGVALKHGVGILYFSGRNGFCREATVHPADGAIGIPLQFSIAGRGEAPNPVPGTDDGKGCGFPVLMRLVGKYKDLTAAEVRDAAGKPVAGTFSSPAKPANPQWPSNSDCALFIPSRPLLPNMTYKVSFKFKESDAPVTWSFTTGK